MEITLDEARHLIAPEHGFSNWRELEAFTKSVKPGRRFTAKPLRLVVRKGPDHWEPIAGSRDWEEVLELLARHPTAGLSGQGQMTDDLLDEGISRLPSFPALRELMPMDVPDAGYRHIGKCDRLESLILMYCRDTTDAATEHITGLRHRSYYFNSYTATQTNDRRLL